MSDFRNDPEYVARRRQIIRDNHPDRGGSDEQLIEALRALDEQWARRSFVKAQLRENLPPFVDAEKVSSLVDRAEIVTDQVRQRANRIVHGADELRQRLAPRDSVLDNVARQLGATAGKARHRLGEEIAKRRR